MEGTAKNTQPSVFGGYLEALSGTLARVEATDRRGAAIAIADAVQSAVEAVSRLHRSSNKVIFIGNGGSAAIASHLAIDYMRNGEVGALSFNDGASLTCLANDFGYEQVFVLPIEVHARAGDLLIAISSSGRSANILNAVAAARKRDMRVITMSGFLPDNPLRGLGDLNFYVPNREYGFVEISHLVLCHAFLDLKMGWTGSGRDGE